MVLYTNKYDIFFESVKQFAIATEMSQIVELEGASLDEIYEFERTHLIKFPIAFISYLKVFGKNSKFRETDFDFHLTFSDIETALKGVEKQNPIKILEMGDFKVNYDDNENYPHQNEGEYRPALKELLNLNDITFYSWDQGRRGFSFFDNTQENPVCFYLMESLYVVSDFYSFTNFVRTVMFNVLISLASEYEKLLIRETIKHLTLNPKKIDWLSRYIRIYIDNKDKNRNDIIECRKEFYKINDEREMLEDRILTIDEFEISFMNFLEGIGYKFGEQDLEL